MTPPALPSTEEQIDAILGAAQAIAPVLDDKQIDCITDDLARRIYPPDVIAGRYGFTAAQLLEFVAIPAIRNLIRAKRSIWESDTSAVDRARQYWAIGMEQAAPGLINLMHDSSVAPSNRIEALKVGAKLSGMDTGRDTGTGAATGAQFAVNIHFGSGRIEKMLSAPVIEGDVS